MVGDHREVYSLLCVRTADAETGYPDTGLERRELAILKGNKRLSRLFVISAAPERAGSAFCTAVDPDGCSSRTHLFWPHVKISWWVYFHQHAGFTE